MPQYVLRSLLEWTIRDREINFLFKNSDWNYWVSSHWPCFISVLFVSHDHYEFLSFILHIFIIFSCVHLYVTCKLIFTIWRQMPAEFREYQIPIKSFVGYGYAKKKIKVVYKSNELLNPEPCSMFVWLSLSHSSVSNHSCLSLSLFYR